MTFKEKIKETFINIKLTFTDYHGKFKIKKNRKGKDGTVLVIRRRYGKAEGFMSTFLFVMKHVEMAEALGYIPCVEDQLTGGLFKLKNSISAETASQYKKVIYSGWGGYSHADFCKNAPAFSLYMSAKNNERKKEILDKYVEWDDKILSMLEKERAIIEPSKCLGVYLRGTDYLKLKPSGHPIQPTVEDVLDDIREILEKEKLEKIFLVTEDQKIHEKMRSLFLEKLVTVQNDRYVEKYDGEKYVCEFIKDVDLNNQIYIVKTMLLAECFSFVGGRTNGSLGALALNGGKYSTLALFDKGYYQ